MADSEFSWTAFYEEFASKLLDFENRRDELIQKLVRAFESINMPLPRLDYQGVPEDIDPFTVVALFNKSKMKDENRKKIIAGLAQEFGVQASQPKDFDGIPTVQALNATFYAFSNDNRRGSTDIDNLWKLYRLALAYADGPTEATRSAFIDCFDATKGQFSLKWRITTGLYWVRPFAFVSLDSRNRWYLGDQAKAGAAIAALMPKEKSNTVPDGAPYLQLVDEIESHFGSPECPAKSLPELSYMAWLESERVNKERAKESKEAQEESLGDAGVETIQYWVVAPGAESERWEHFHRDGIIGLAWSRIGSVDKFDSKVELAEEMREAFGGDSDYKVSAHALWQFRHGMKPGDVIYAKKGRSKIIGRGIVKSDYRFDDSREDGYRNVRSVEWTHKGNWKYPGMAPMKALTEITDNPELVEQLESLFVNDSGDRPKTEPVQLVAYSREDFLDEVFVDPEDYDTLADLLREKMNVVLQGAPGVGKTFAAKRLAYSLMGEKDPERVMMVQFHQSYSYEDFVVGIRPTLDGFDLKFGAFYNFCKKAAEDAERDYFFIIDEINRGNISKIFGELFMLIEKDKRGSKNKLQLLYSDELFFVPSNLYIIGMMNTADRGLAMLDYALRRRFAFFELEPSFDSQGFREYQAKLASPSFDRLIARVKSLNEAIANDDSLGAGFRIGHSYFCNLSLEDLDNSRLARIVKYEIAPLLREYWFDDPKKAESWVSQLQDSVK